MYYLLILYFGRVIIILLRNEINYTSKSIPTIDLYEYNLETYNNICEIWKRTNRASVIQATGTGKTYLMLKCIYDFYYQSVVVLAPSNYILDQLNKKANYNLPNVKLLTYTKLSFMSEDEIAKLNPSLIVLDEFHRCGAEQWGNGIQKLLDISSNAKVLGTTATPVRFLDNERDMADELFEGEIAVNLSLAQAIVREILPMPKYISALYTFDDEVSNLEEKINNSKNDDESKTDLLKQLKVMKKKLQKSKGVPSILSKHLQGFTGGKFVLFCKDSNHMNDIKQSVIDWFKEAKIGKKVESYSILSGASGNKKELSDFANNTKNDNVRLLFTINMLNEGVHIDDVTGVILLRPTTSPIIYFQQIGRAIQAGNKQSPLIFDLVNNFNSMGSRTFKEELDKAREEEIEKMKGEGKSKEEINIPDFVIHDEMKDIIDVFGKIEEQLQDNWEAMFQKYKSGDYDEKDWRIKKWLQKQRIDYRKNIITEDKLEKLNFINFVWDITENKWNEMFEQLQLHYQLHGHHVVLEKENQKLNFWIFKQRKEFKKNKLTDEKIKKLSKIKFKFIYNHKEEVWEKNYNDCLRYVEENSNTKSPIKNNSLELWYEKQMKNKDILEEDKINKLNTLDFKSFEETNKYKKSKEEKWNENFLMLIEFKVKYGHCRVPINFKMDNFNLGSWVAGERTNYKYNGLSEERIKKLESIGFVWNVMDLIRSYKKPIQVIIN